MPKGDNSVVINLTTELKIFIDNNKGDLERSFYIALAYLEKNKDAFIEKYGKQCYEDHVKRYSRTAIEMRNDKQKRKEEWIKRREEELDLKRKELDVKKANSQTYGSIIESKEEERKEEKLSEIEDLKQEIAKNEDNYKKVQNAQSKEFFKKKVEELKQKLSELQQEPQKEGETTK